MNRAIHSQLITVGQTAEYLGLTNDHVYALIRTKSLPPGVAIRFGRQIRILRPALDKWVEAGGQALPGGWRKEPQA